MSAEKPFLGVGWKRFTATISVSIALAPTMASLMRRTILGQQPASPTSEITPPLESENPPFFESENSPRAVVGPYCLVPSLQAEWRVDQALDLPDSQGLRRAYRLERNAFKDPNLSSAELEERLEAPRIFREKEAAKHGLHLVDPESYQRRVDQAKSTAEVLGILDEFMGRYGASFEMPRFINRQKNPNFHRAVGRAKLKLDVFINKAWYCMEQMSYYPRELVELANLKRLTVVKSFTESYFPISDDYGSPAALAWSENIAVAWPFLNSMDIFGHELYHLLDGVLCNGEARKDPAFKGLNRETFHYRRRSKKMLKTVRIPYGATNVVEDKATLMEVFLRAINDDDYSGFTKTRRAKFELLLQRLEERSPGVTTYLRNAHYEIRGHQIF